MKKKICTSNKLVSIITPAYNAHGYIEAAIESVIAQTYQNWEMLVANDCSNDDTAQIVEKYASEDSRIKLLNLPQNGGVAKARNYAIERAEGAYIAFLDADDMWLPDKLEKQIEFMEEKNAAFSFTSYEIIDEKGEKTGKYVSSKKTMRANEILRNTLIGCLTVVVNREQVGDFRMPLISHAEDSMAWHEILKRGYVAYGLPEILAQYRVTNSSLTSSKKKVAKLHWKNYRSYCGFGLVKSGLYFTSYAFHAATKAKKNKK
ncbi:MAG: glycosyltransferase family 2 protein [Mogibacterium sp.]|nr:glycosyltransferase family 2 protein [Mogibacterium sp.]